MIFRISYRLPHRAGVAFETDWVCPSEGYDRHRALESFLRLNPSAVVDALTEVTNRYRKA